MAEPTDLPLRERLAAHRRLWLAHYAVDEAHSGGRAVSEPEHDYRTCFQRDRDRVIHASAFRRLDYKTQVFVPHVKDHFRTRLTHTIEVAQVARNLARAMRLNDDLAEAVALAHDLGHPPFGHAGETTLDELMAGHGHFEHNRQSLRVVDYLEHPYPDFYGLNLTRITRECLAKHVTRYDAPVCEDFDPALHAPLEGQLVDAGDEIAYTSADLDDAFQAGWLTEDDLAEVELWRRAWDRVESRWPDARPIHKQIRATKAVLEILCDDLIVTTAAAIDRLGIASPDDARRAPQRAVGFSPPTAEAMGQLQQLLLERVYLHPLSRDADAEGQGVIRDLFAHFVEKPHDLPGRFQRRIERDGRHRVICDYIAGMTDRYCLAEHKRLVS